MWQFRREKPGNSGITLIEIVIAMALMAIISLVLSKILGTVNSSTQHQSAQMKMSQNLEEMMQIIEKHWLTRERKDGVGTPFTAARKSFALQTSSGSPCTSNCPRLEIKVIRSGVSDTITVASQCRNPGAFPARSRWDLLDLNGALASRCLPCPRGQMPIVQVQSAKFPAQTRYFPANGVTTPLRMTEALGFQACFDQTGTGPTLVKVMMLSLDQKIAPEGVMGKLTQRILAFDNFGQVTITQ